MTELSEQWICIAVYHSPVDAGLARSLLDGSGIDTQLRNEHTVSILPHLSGAMGGIELWVPEPDAGDAIAILSEPEET